MNLKDLTNMKIEMAERGNWKEVKRINRMIELNDYKVN